MAGCFQTELREKRVGDWRAGWPKSKAVSLRIWISLKLEDKKLRKKPQAFGQVTVSLCPLSKLLNQSGFLG